MLCSAVRRGASAVRNIPRSPPSPKPTLHASVPDRSSPSSTARLLSTSGVVADLPASTALRPDARVELAGSMRWRPGMAVESRARRRLLLQVLMFSATSRRFRSAWLTKPRARGQQPSPCQPNWKRPAQCTKNYPGGEPTSATSVFLTNFPGRPGCMFRQWKSLLECRLR